MDVADRVQIEYICRYACDARKSHMYIAVTYNDMGTSDDFCAVECMFKEFLSGRGVCAYTGEIFI